MNFSVLDSRCHPFRSSPQSLRTGPSLARKVPPLTWIPLGPSSSLLIPDVISVTPTVPSQARCAWTDPSSPNLGYTCPRVGHLVSQSRTRGPTPCTPGPPPRQTRPLTHVPGTRVQTPPPIPAGEGEECGPAAPQRAPPTPYPSKEVGT